MSEQVQIGRRYVCRANSSMHGVAEYNDGFCRIRYDDGITGDWVSPAMFLEVFSLAIEPETPIPTISVGDVLVWGDGSIRSTCVVEPKGLAKIQFDNWPGRSGPTVCDIQSVRGWLACGAATLEKKREPFRFEGTVHINEDGGGIFRSEEFKIGVNFPKGNAPKKLTIICEGVD